MQTIENEIYSNIKPSLRKKSISISNWVSSSKVQKKHYQHDSQRYKYRQISEAGENNLNNVSKVNNNRLSKLNSEISESTTSNNNPNKCSAEDDDSSKSIANATVVTYESWDSLAMFKPKVIEKKIKVYSDLNETRGTYSFKKMLKRINDERISKKQDNGKKSLKKVKEKTKSKSDGTRPLRNKSCHGVSVSKVEHNTIKNWLIKNESKYAKYSAHNQLKNIQMKISSSTFETIPSLLSSDPDKNSDPILNNINKVLRTPSTSQVSRIKQQLLQNIQRSSQNKERIVKNNNDGGFTSIAKNLRNTYLKAAGKVIKGVYKQKESYKIGKIFSFSSHTLSK